MVTVIKSSAVHTACTEKPVLVSPFFILGGKKSLYRFDNDFRKLNGWQHFFRVDFGSMVSQFYRVYCEYSTRLGDRGQVRITWKFFA